MDGSDGRQGKARATMMDVASLAGVSQATVSLVLNGSPGAKLTDGTRRRVRDAAARLGYEKPRRRTRRTAEVQPAILFLCDDIATDPWMMQAFDGAQRKAAEHGMNVLLAVSGDRDGETAVMEQIAATPISGVIYATMLTRLVEPSSAVLGHRTVLLNAYDTAGRLPSVVPDDVGGGRTATRHLIEAGCRRIGFINGQKGIDASRDRLKGYRQALTAAGLRYDPKLVRPGTWEPESGYAHTRALLALDTPPDAIFCANDPMAYGCYEALREAGLRVPDDISVVGFDDRDLAKAMHPPLTTLLLPHAEMGELAADRLIGMAGGDAPMSARMRVDCALVPRASVRPPD